ncbi:MAG: hypothetical protein U1A78_06230 [Polyangia bacterium]
MPGLAGCRKAGSERPAATATATASAPAAAGPSSGTELTRVDLLLQLLSMTHAELTARLGPHRLESRTQWTITPVGQPAAPAAGVAALTPGFKPGMPEKLYEGAAAFESTPTALEETRSIAVDGAGRILLASQNDRGAGIEAIYDQDSLYVRMRHAPFIRHRPEGDQLARLRAATYESGAALVEAVAPYVQLGTPTEASANGRPAWQVSLGLREKPQGAQARGATSPQSAWRAATAVELLDGSATVDRQKGAPVQVSLHVRFTAPRPGTDGEKVQIEARHTLSVVVLGESAPKIALPTEWSEAPTRPRPTTERQELLQGLVQGRP